MSASALKPRKRWKPTRRGDLVTRLVDGQEIWYFDGYVQWDRFAPAKRVRKSTMCLKADYARAQEVRDQIRERLKDGDDKLRRAITFSEWVPIWRHQYEREHAITAETILRHDQTIRLLLEFFGNRRMDQVTDGDCIAFRDWRMSRPVLNNQGAERPGVRVSANTARVDCYIASLIWKGAVRARKVPTNPWTSLKLGAITSRTRVLTEDEQRAVLALADPRTMRFIVVVLGTSFRVGLLLKLPLDPIEVVEWRGQQIPIIKRLSKQKVHSQPLLPIVVEAIHEQAAYVRAEYPGATRLFPYGYTTVRVWLKRLAQQAGIPSFSPHDIRRTFATRSHEVVSLDQIAMLLNNTPAVAQKHYVHLSDGADAGRKLLALRSIASALALPASVSQMDTDGNSKPEVVES
jgi:integrase